MAIIDRRGISVTGAPPSAADTPDVALAIKLAVRVASTANLTLAGLQTVDGVSLMEGNRILAKNQTDATQNGIYVVSSGNWSRSVDFDASREIASGVVVSVSAGTAGAQKMYQLRTADPIVLDTSSLTWVVLSGQTGATGPTGPTGATGATGAAGPTSGRVILTADRTYYVRTQPVAATSITNASPGVVNATAHGLAVNDPVVFSTTGSLPTGLTASTIYYVIAGGFGTNAFQVSTSLGGSAVNTSSVGSGTHSFQTGNDSNNGLVQTRTGALLTIAAADLLARAVDINNKVITVQLADGAWLTPVVITGILTGQTSPSNYVIKGNNSSPANVSFVSTAGNCFSATNGAMVMVQDMSISGYFAAFACTLRSTLYVGNIILGPSATNGLQLLASSWGWLEAVGALTISGAGGRAFCAATHQGHIRFSVGLCPTITVTANLTYQQTAWATSLGDVTFTGYVASPFSLGAFTVTAKRYVAEHNGIIQQLVSANFFPGNVAGTTATGGDYE